MKKLSLILAAAAISAAASAQTVSDLSTDFQTRTGITADWKIARGLHLEGGYELRSRNNMSDIANHRVSLGMTYKFTSGIKTGIEYTYIHHHKSNALTWAPRHRISASASYTIKSGSWRFSLKEQLRLTHKNGANECEEPVNAFTLKSRIKVSYKGLGKIEPYAFIEGRNLLNAALVNATYSTASGKWANYSFGGYGFAKPYFNRVRGAIGLEWELSKHSAVDFCVMEDYCYERNIDVNKDRNTLNSFTLDPALNTIASIGYKFSF